MRSQLLRRLISCLMPASFQPPPSIKTNKNSIFLNYQRNLKGPHFSTYDDIYELPIPPVLPR